jgi:flavin reductase (DIM6/NTAB) family NADH-FMN oxidoreductase RutF
MPVNQNQLRKVMRWWTSGVTVVSVNNHGVEHGMTVSSFTSVSLDPPLIIISLMKGSRTLELITGSNSFAITILSSEQTEISNVFAGQISDNEDRFADFETEWLASGSPVIKGGLAYLDCEVIEIFEFVSNSLIIGEVIAAEVGELGNPLLYFDQHYHQLQE